MTLVGALLADMSLYVDDFRAAERTFSLLTQVIGRAGRAEKRGRAVIQTNNPDNEVIRLACAQDYPAFYAREEALRRALVFPPFCDIVLLTLSSTDEQALMRQPICYGAACQRLPNGSSLTWPTWLSVPLRRRFTGSRDGIGCEWCSKQAQPPQPGPFGALYERFAAKAPAKTVLTVDYNPSNL